MSKEIQVPDIGDFEGVDVIEVLVAEGDHVAVDDPLITLESDKASMEIPSTDAGVVKAIKVKVGDKLSQGSPILDLEVEGSSESEPAVEPESTMAEASVAEASATPATAQPATAQPAAAQPTPPPPAPPTSVDETAFSRVHASPSVRRLARELGVDLGKVSGTGRKGRITKEDVQGFVSQAMSPSAAPTAAAPAATASGIPAMPAVDFAKFGEVEAQDLSRIKKISGAHLHRAWLNVPMVTHHDEADITELEAFRKSLKAEAEKQGVRVTMLAFMMKALVATLKQFPEFNASLSADGQQLILKKYFHIGIAVDTPKGLVVPVFRDVDQKSIYDLAAEMGELSSRARDGKLKPEEMQGGCMSISSLGGIGGTAFTPIVNAPEVAILGATRSRMMPVWNGQEFVPRLMQPLDLTYDHRVIDGAAAARFMSHLCALLGDIRRLLL